MKRILLTLTFCGITLIAKSQNASVEKSTFGIQTGFLGIWTHNETKLSNSIVLRTEIGFDSGIWGGDFYDGTGFLMTPVITFEPRLYYNLNKRVKKSRRIDGNSGNFVSLKTSYHPDWFVISNTENVSIISDISIIPTWGIRRNIGKHFNYEAGIGIGYRYIFAKQAGFLENESEAAANLHLRIGYRF
ncbi:hypothetical protein Q4Q34_18340 [Flavivirga abyssicola]|uniref:hypothetical protein n=1 Tax=Flavivirga abyssicola TaxID=3063533 RepID=UPI0026E09CDD|nr:hypothetical protein [Flavivirga sp. MEBiC07777]WVK13177.1 hypothetical protein Q4Q34_18340 [Flavivirga sp. MEBiC07777]